MPTQQSYTFASHTSQPTSQSLQKSMPAPRQDKFNFFLPSLRCFNFFPTAQNILKFYANPQMAHLVLPATQANPSAKPKEQNFPTARVTRFKITCIFDTSVQNKLSK
jgi:hypothetical protein